MKKYRVHTESDCSQEFDVLVQAEQTFERWKDNSMEDGVIVGESYVEIAESEDNFEDYRVIKKVVAAIDNDTGLGSPREEGMDWDYWAKWEDDVINLPEEGTTKQIKVKAIEEFEVYNHDKSILLNRVYEGEEFEATFDTESGEYHSNDSEGRELYIGTIDINGNLELDESFVLIGPEEGTTE